MTLKSVSSQTQDTMKIVMLIALVAVGSAVAVHNPKAAEIGVVRDDRDGPIEANYKYVLETENGIKIEESGAAGSAGQSNSNGVFSYLSPEGVNVEVAYTADENGFQPRGDFIHPIPEHAQEQIRIGEQLRAQGVKFDERGFKQN